MLFSLAVILCNIFISSLWSRLNQPSKFWFYLQHNFLKEGFFLNIGFIYSWASLVVELVKSLTAMQETWVRCLGWEDPLEKEMATHSNILTWRIPRTEKPGSLHTRVGRNWMTKHTHTHTSYRWIIFSWTVTILPKCPDISISIC